VHYRAPGTSMEQIVEWKERSTGVVRDLLPGLGAVPRDQILPNKHERLLMKGSVLYQKRNRKPKVDLDSNPVCVERQLTDQYELMRVNRNPALYRPTKADDSRTVSMLNQHTKNLADSDVDSIKLRILEDAGAEAAAAKMRRELVAAGHVSSRSVDPRIEASNIPNFDTYSKDRNAIGDVSGPTYGQKHKPRIYNPLSHDLTRKAGPGSDPGRAGSLSVAQLRNLLGGAQPEKSVQSSGYGQPKASTTRVAGGPRKAASRVAGPIDLEAELNYGTLYEEHITAKPKWDSSFSTPLAIREAQNTLPHPGASILQREEALETTFREKLAVSASIAAGTALRDSDFCRGRQQLDREDLTLAGLGRTRQQAPLNEQVSPRRNYQREEHREIMRERRRREEDAAERVRVHESAEIRARIPQPSPLSLSIDPSQMKTWDTSFLLSERGY